MMKSEFEERIGCEVSMEVYEIMEKKYMESTEDKDKFCKRCKRENTIIKVMQELLDKKNDTIKRTRELAEKQKAYGQSEIDNENNLEANKEEEKRSRESKEKNFKYYGNNRYLMGLSETVCACNILDELNK